MTLLAVLLAFVLAAAAPLIYRVAGRQTGWVLGILTFALFLALLREVPGVADGMPSAASLPWAPLLDVELAFRADGLALLMALLITGIGAGIFVYAGAYMEGKPRLGYFYAVLMFFMASMLGLVLADNLVVLYVFWELTSISSFVLIGFEHGDRESRANAQQALLVTAAGGLALLGGLVMLATAGGSWSVSELLTRGDAIREHTLYLPALVLVLLGAFTKSAQVPFHFWLPNAMVAPTPVSAYLHSATMVKAGVFLLARLHPALGDTLPWLLVLTVVGGVTMLFGAIVAVQQRDAKRILAYTTVSALGTLTLLAGLGTDLAMKAFAAWLLAHALYKGALFMVAGTLDHETGTRDVTRLSGLARFLPLTAAAAVLAGISMAGLPFLLGFVAKEALFEATIERGAEGAGMLLAGAAVVLGALGFLAAGIVVVRPLFGRRLEPVPHGHGESAGFWLPALALALLGLVLGTGVGPTARWLIGPAAAAAAGHPVAVTLHAVPYPTVEMLLSVIAIALGLAGYLARDRIRGGLEGAAARMPWTADRAYDATIATLDRVARLQTLALQSGRLRVYLLIMLLTTVPLVATPLLIAGAIRLPTDLETIAVQEVGVAGLVVAAALFAALTRSRLGAVAALGVVGYGLALIWVLFGAPDLGMTQFLIETLTVLLLVFVFYHLPMFQRRPGRWVTIRDAVVAAGVGVMITGLMLVALAAPSDRPMAEFYLEASRPAAHGRNVVNTILVDFRALDTLGEITVLAAAAIGVVALLRFLRRDDAA